MIWNVKHNRIPPSIWYGRLGKIQDFWHESKNLSHVAGLDLVSNQCIHLLTDPEVWLLREVVSLLFYTERNASTKTMSAVTFTWVKEGRLFCFRDFPHVYLYKYNQHINYLTKKSINIAFINIYFLNKDCSSNLNLRRYVRHRSHTELKLDKRSLWFFA